MSKLDLRAWTYDGRKLAHPLRIGRRLLALPVLWAGKLLVFAGLCLGWGLTDAVDTWRELP